jgi:hypothetical protein
MYDEIESTRVEGKSTTEEKNQGRGKRYDEGERTKLEGKNTTSEKGPRSREK